MVQGHQNKGGGVGIGVTGKSPIVSHNTILNMSYNGIVFSGCSNAQVINNYVNGYEKEKKIQKNMHWCRLTLHAKVRHTLMDLTASSIKI
jgi:parallel beta-helix repeat protein